MEDVEIKRSALILRPLIAVDNGAYISSKIFGEFTYYNMEIHSTSRPLHLGTLLQVERFSTSDQPNCSCRVI